MKKRTNVAFLARQHYDNININHYDGNIKSEGTICTTECPRSLLEPDVFEDWKDLENSGQTNERASSRCPLHARADNGGV